MGCTFNWICVYLGLTLFVQLRFAAVVIPTPGTCQLSENCAKSGEVCIYDDEQGCIRKFSSKCVMELDACKKRLKYDDFSIEYCSMETYLCEEGYERWTIFFGYKNI